MRCEEKILRGVTHVNGSDNNYRFMYTSCLPHAHILLAPTTLYYSAKYYQRPSLYAYCFYQVSQRGTSMPRVQRPKEISLYFWTSISGRQGQQTNGLLFIALSNFNNSVSHERFKDCTCWNFHHVSLLCAWLPLAAQCFSLTSMHTPA